MAVSANTIWEVRIDGNNTNGGGFVAGASGTDWSQQAAAQYSVTDGVTAGTTTITSASANFGTDVVGNIMYVQGGTGSVAAGWYQITVRNSSTSVTVDRSTGLTAGTGVTLIIGGALLSPAIGCSLGATIGQICFVKYSASAFSITTASANVAGGCLNMTQGTIICGYDTTRTLTNTDANRPILQLNVASATVGTGTGLIRNFVLDGNTQTTSTPSSGNGYFNCHIKNFNTGSSSSLFYYCTATTNSAAVISGTYHYCCEAYANTATPYNAGVFVNCLSYGNTGASTDGFSIGQSGSCISCVAYGNGRHGIVFSANNRPILVVNCILVSNAGYGLYFASANAYANYDINSATYNNTLGARTGNGQAIGSITLTVDPFVNAASSNFALNATSGGGALVRATGFPATFPRGLSASFLDVGAIQHGFVTQGTPF